MGYLVIFRDEDEPSLEWYLTKESLLANFESYMGNFTFIESGSMIPYNLMNWPSQTAVAIKGEVVAPKPKRVVEKYDIA